MKIEELQGIWTELSAELEKQKKLTHEIIIKMTRERYRNKLQKIAIYEGIGAIICFAAALFLLVNFGKLDSWYLMLCGLFTICYLLVLPILVFRSIRQMSRIDIAKGHYTDNLLAFSKARSQFLFLQRIGIGLAFVLMVTALPVASKIMKDRDLFAATATWYWYIPIMLIFLVFFSRWGYRSYRSITLSAENLIRDLENKE